MMGGIKSIAKYLDRVERLVDRIYAATEENTEADKKELTFVLLVPSRQWMKTWRFSPSIRLSPV